MLLHLFAYILLTLFLLRLSITRTVANRDISAEKGSHKPTQKDRDFRGLGYVFY